MPPSTTLGTAVSSFAPCPNDSSLLPLAVVLAARLGDARPVDRRTRVVELQVGVRVDLEVAAREAHLGVARQGCRNSHEREDHDEPDQGHPTGPGAAAAALQCHFTFLDTVVCACSPDVTSGSRRTSALSPLRMSAPFPGCPSPRGTSLVRLAPVGITAETGALTFRARGSPVRSRDRMVKMRRRPHASVGRRSDGSRSPKNRTLSSDADDAPCVNGG